MFRAPLDRSLKNIAFLFLLLLTFAETQAQKNTYHPDQRYPVDQLREDFQILHTAFYREHPGWGKYHPEDSMETWFQETAGQIDRPMTELEFRRLLYPLIARLGCGHTRIRPSRAYLKYEKKRRKAKELRQLLPFQAQKIDSRLIVLYGFTKDSSLLLPGTEILAIDGLAASEIMAKIQSRFPSDGYNQSHKEKAINLDFNAFYRSHFGECQEFDLTFRQPEGDTLRLKLPAFSLLPKPTGRQRKKRSHSQKLKTA